MKKNIKLCILLEVNELSENKDDMIQEESLTIIKEAYKPTLFVPTLAIVVAIGPYGSMLLTIADGNEANLMGAALLTLPVLLFVGWQWSAYVHKQVRSQEEVADYQRDPER